MSYQVVHRSQLPTYIYHRRLSGQQKTHLYSFCWALKEKTSWEIERIPLKDHWAHQLNWVNGCEIKRRKWDKRKKKQSKIKKLSTNILHVVIYVIPTCQLLTKKQCTSFFRHEWESEDPPDTSVQQSDWKVYGTQQADIDRRRLIIVSSCIVQSQNGRHKNQRENTSRRVLGTTLLTRGTRNENNHNYYPCFVLDFRWLVVFFSIEAFGSYYSVNR